MVLAKHGMVLYTGGSDGYVRAWLLRDQELVRSLPAALEKSTVQISLSPFAFVLEMDCQQCTL